MPIVDFINGTKVSALTLDTEPNAALYEAAAASAELTRERAERAR